MIPGVRLKKGASIKGIQPEMLFALIVVSPIMFEYGQECVVTSGTDGKHSKNSKHYLGYAIDLRSWVLRDTSTEAHCAKDMQDALGAEFLVLVEGSHIHVQFNGTT